MTSAAMYNCRKEVGAFKRNRLSLIMDMSRSAVGERRNRLKCTNSTCIPLIRSCCPVDSLVIRSCATSQDVPGNSVAFLCKLSLACLSYPMPWSVPGHSLLTPLRSLLHYAVPCVLPVLRFVDLPFAFNFKCFPFLRHMFSLHPCSSAPAPLLIPW